MDRAIENNTRLFDVILERLTKHFPDDTAVEVHEYLKAAKFNYQQRDIDHMVFNLALALDRLAARNVSGELKQDLRKTIRRFVKDIDASASKMIRLSDEYRASGGKLLSPEEVREEVNARRGISR
jgi:hypothetical protein